MSRYGFKILQDDASRDVSNFKSSCWYKLVSALETKVPAAEEGPCSQVRIRQISVGVCLHMWCGIRTSDYATGRFIPM